MLTCGCSSSCARISVQNVPLSPGMLCFILLQKSAVVQTIDGERMAGPSGKLLRRFGPPLGRGAWGLQWGGETLVQKKYCRQACWSGRHSHKEWMTCLSTSLALWLQVRILSYATNLEAPKIKKHKQLLGGKAPPGRLNRGIDWKVET